MYSVWNLRAGTVPVLLFDWRIEEGGRKARNEREGVVTEGGRDERRVWRCGAVLGTVALCWALWRCVARYGPVFGAVALCVVLCCVVLCCVVLCCVVLCCVVLCCVVLCCVVLCCVVLCCVVLCCVVLCCVVLCCVVLCCVVLCCAVLYLSQLCCVVLCCVVLCCVVLCCVVLCCVVLCCVVLCCVVSFSVVLCCVVLCCVVLCCVALYLSQVAKHGKVITIFSSSQYNSQDNNSAVIFVSPIDSKLRFVTKGNQTRETLRIPLTPTAAMSPREKAFVERGGRLASPEQRRWPLGE